MRIGRFSFVGRRHVFDQTRRAMRGGLLFFREIHLADFVRDGIGQRVRGDAYVYAHAAGVFDDFAIFELEFFC